LCVLVCIMALVYGISNTGHTIKALDEGCWEGSVYVGEMMFLLSRAWLVALLGSLLICNDGCSRFEMLESETSYWVCWMSLHVISYAIYQTEEAPDKKKLLQAA